MRHRLWAAILGIGLGVSLVAARADDPPKKEDASSSPAEKLAAIRKEVSDKAQVLMTAQKELRAAKDDEEKKAKQEAYNKVQNEYREVFMAAAAKYQALAKAHPSDPVAMDAVMAALPMTPPNARGELFKIVGEHHINSPKISNLLTFLSRDTSAEAKALLERVAKESTNKTARGMANFAMVSADVEKLAGYQSQATKADFDKLKPELDKKIEALLSEYGEISAGRGKIGDQVKQLQERLGKISALLIGQPAPEIAAEDIDGKPFKLSDYRGKVVMLDFWGDW